MPTGIETKRRAMQSLLPSRCKRPGCPTFKRRAPWVVSYGEPKSIGEAMLTILCIMLGAGSILYDWNN